MGSLEIRPPEISTSPALDPKTKIIPESDLYRLIMWSPLPAADQFRDWIVEEVLPSLRKQPKLEEIPREHEIQLFENPTFGSVRVLTISNEPWFVAVDVCKCLDLTNPSDILAKCLDEDEKTLISSTLYSIEGASNLSIPPAGLNAVSEAGLYSLIFRSRKPEAKEFKRWVTHEVLPAIRKTGEYTQTTAKTELSYGDRVLVGNSPSLLREAIFVGYQVIDNETKTLAIVRGKTSVSKWKYCQPYNTVAPKPINPVNQDFIDFCL